VTAPGRGRAAVILGALLTLPLLTPRIRGADEIEYFAYLRSAVFDRDLSFGNEYEHFHAQDPEGLAGFRATFLDLREPSTGRHINFAPLGSAVLWSPLYLAAHAAVLAARALGADVAADGFSTPYVLAACLASWAWGVAGVLVIHDALRRFGGYGEPAAAAAALALLWGSPLLYYMTLAPAFSHATSVFTVSALLWASLRAWHEERPLAAWAAVGALGGISALVREQDGLFLVVPCVLAASGARRGSPGRALARLAVMGAAAALAFVPQLLAYRAVNGAFGPSRLVTRKMLWGSPHFVEVLFDPGHGLFAWSPLLLVAAAGLLARAARRRDLPTAAFLLALLVQVWINGAVDSWTQAGAFGSRRFVGATALFAWGLAFVLDGLRARLAAWAPAAVVALFAWWNVSLMVQFGLRLMDRQRLEWPRVAVNQVTAVPARAAGVAALFFSDRERLVRESR
jgi:hypothetical protein